MRFSPACIYTTVRRRQTKAYLEGVALQRHANSAHGGQVSSTCPACREIRLRMAAAEQRKVTKLAFRKRRV